MRGWVFKKLLAPPGCCLGVLSRAHLEAALESEGDLGGHVRQLLLNQLVGSQRGAKLGPNERVVKRFSSFVPRSIKLYFRCVLRSLYFFFVMHALTCVCVFIMSVLTHLSSVYCRAVSRQAVAAPRAPQLMPNRALFRQLKGPPSPRAEGSILAAGTCQPNNYQMGCRETYRKNLRATTIRLQRVTEGSRG